MRRKLGMANPADWEQFHVLVSAHRTQLRFCLRVTVAGLFAFAVARVLPIPLHGLWVVLTAVVVTEMSAGRSLRATVEYMIGTFGDHHGGTGTIVSLERGVTVSAQLPVLLLAGQAPVAKLERHGGDRQLIRSWLHPSTPFAHLIEKFQIRGLSEMA
jgi:hypothetical protein